MANITSLSIGDNKIIIPRKVFFSTLNVIDNHNTAGTYAVDVGEYLPSIEEAPNAILTVRVHMWGANKECHLDLNGYTSSIYTGGENDSIEIEIPLINTRTFTKNLSSLCGGCEIRLVGYEIANTRMQ